VSNGELDYIYGDIDGILGYYENVATSYYAEPTLSSIRESFDALGYDVEKQADRFDTIITMLVLSEEWGVDSAVLMMEALEDDWITEAEVDTLMGLDAIPPIIYIKADDDAESASIVIIVSKRSACFSTS